VTFPEQQQPIISTPEELLARGEMPQVQYQGAPYEKTSRVPEGFEPLESGLVAYLRDRMEGDITSRTLTMHAGRIDWLVDDPDVPREAKSRHALFAVALTEGAEPIFWVWVFEEAADPGAVIVSDFLSEAEARTAYADATVNG
jgi:hypothetical protein